MPDDACTLYVYSDAIGITLYVGITGRGLRRWGEHIESSQWWPHTASASFWHYPTEAQARAAEKETIRKLHPVFNVQHNVDSAPLRAFYASGFGDIPVRAGSFEAPMGIAMIGDHDGNGWYRFPLDFPKYGHQVKRGLSNLAKDPARLRDDNGGCVGVQLGEDEARIRFNGEPSPRISVRAQRIGGRVGPWLAARY